MKFCALTSGSKGNMFYVEDGTFHILIDVGVTVKKAEELLKQINVDPKSINAILVTHEHSDHILGVPLLSKKYSIPVYTYKDNQKALLSLSEIYDHVSTFSDFPFLIGKITVMPYRVRHDASSCFAFSFVKGGKKLTLLTDLGCFDENVLDFAKGSDFIYLESNHDRCMLMEGPYPPILKQRIIGIKGHLSNDQASKFIYEVADENLRQICLGHLSEKNNDANLVYEKIKATIEEKNLNTEIHIALQNEPTEIFEV